VAEPDNVAGECQLNELGKKNVVAIAEAILRLHIRIDEVFTSPAYRARQTARLLGFPHAFVEPRLDDVIVPDREPAFFCATLREPLRTGSNALIVTHMPNLVSYLAGEISAVIPGEILVCRCVDSHGLSLIARIPPERWPQLEAASREEAAPG
jgi:phosphohistidine phosphatase SixA